MQKVVKVVTKKKPVKVVKRVHTLTPKQQTAINLLMAGNGRSKADILRESGYSPSVVDAPTKVFDSPAVIAVLNPWLERLKAMRERILGQMELKVDKASYKDLPRSFDVISNQIALLEGTPTANININMPTEEQERIRRILNL